MIYMFQDGLFYAWTLDLATITMFELCDSLSLADPDW